MRAVIQRVSQASVSIRGEVKVSIQNGLLVLLGIEDADTAEDIEWLSGKIARLRITGKHPVHQSLEIRQRLESRAQLGSLHSAPCEESDAVQSPLDRVYLQKWPADPLLEQAFPHGCDCPVQQAKQRSAALSSKRFFKLKIPTGCGVQRHEVGEAVDAQTGKQA